MTGRPSDGGIEVRGATKRFGDRVVLEDVDLTVESGTITVLVGPSGCGKSTLLRLVNGLVVPDRGTVRCGGVAVTPESSRDVRLAMGYVIQEGGLFPHLSARDNVALMARELAWEPGRVRDRVEELTRLVRLSGDLLDRFPGQLSGGQRQRVSIMRALMLEPRVVLLDEPLGALDPIVRVELQNELKDVFRAVGATVLMVTHDMAEACFFGDLVAVLNAGRIHFEGSPGGLLAEQDPYVRKLVRSHRDLEAAS